MEKNEDWKMPLYNERFREKGKISRLKRKKLRKRHFYRFWAYKQKIRLKNFENFRIFLPKVVC